MTIPPLNHLSAAEQAALRDIKSQIGRMFPVEQFSLFGSKARGDFDEFSDIDILAVIAGSLSGNDKRKISNTVFEVNLKRNTQFCVLSVSSDDFHSEIWSRLPLFRMIASEGVPV
jgi:predicted nucleotidyltransferase